MHFIIYWRNIHEPTSIFLTQLSGWDSATQADKQVIAELLRIVSNAIEKINPTILKRH